MAPLELGRPEARLPVPDRRGHLLFEEVVAGILEDGDRGEDGVRRRAAIEVKEEAGYDVRAEDVFFLHRYEIYSALYDLETGWATSTPARGTTYWPKEVAERKRAVPLSALLERGDGRRAPLDLARALRPDNRREGTVRLIAEIKRASPSRGTLQAALDPTTLAAQYATNGAAAISVLTERRFFQGSLEDLECARAAVTGLAAEIPLLRKDFIFDPYQIYEGYAHGADAVLLIVAALPGDLLPALLETALSLGMSALVEVHDEDELERALAARAQVIGINSRNLRDLSVNRATFERLAPALPADLVAVAESGVQTVADVRHLASLGADAVLVGEALVTASDVAARVREFAGVPRAPSVRQGTP